MPEVKKENIHTALSNVMKKVGVVAKSRSNGSQGYMFRGIDDMYNALHDLLAEEKVVISSEILKVTREVHTSSKGGNLFFTLLEMRFKFVAADETFIVTTTVGEGMDSGDKSAAKAMSTAYKYAFMQMFCIPTEEEKDSEYQSHTTVAKPKVSSDPIIGPNDPDFAPHPSIATPPQEDSSKSFYGATEAQLGLIKKLTKQKGEVGASLTKTYGDVNVLSKLDASKLINELLKLKVQE